MKKYNLSKIMKRAWELVKKSAMTISSGLKKAWEEAKRMEETIEEKLIRLGFKVWEKDDKRRTGQYHDKRMRQYKRACHLRAQNRRSTRAAENCAQSDAAAE